MAKNDHMALTIKKIQKLSSKSLPLDFFFTLEATKTEVFQWHPRKRAFFIYLLYLLS
jgi:hypothetical protein